MVAAACGVGAVNANDHGNTQLVQLAVAIEGGAAAATVGVNLLLLVQLNTGAVQHIHQRNAQALSSVGATQQVISLTGNPGTGVLLVIGSNDHSPLAVDAAQTLDDGVGAGFVIAGVVDAVQRAPGAGIDQQSNALHSGQLTLGVHLFVGGAVCQRLFGKFLQLCLDLLQNGLVVGVDLTQGLADDGHILEVTRHGIIAHCSCSFQIEKENVWLWE